MMELIARATTDRIWITRRGASCARVLRPGQAAVNDLQNFASGGADVLMFDSRVL
jgi:hypothetical protein